MAKHHTPAGGATTVPGAPTPAESMLDKIRAAFAVGKVRWGMLALVFFATTLNYIDRATLGILQPLLSKEMNWTAQDYANINFWFQVGYAGGYVLQGRLIDRIGVRRGFAIAVLLWSIAAASHGLVASALGFMICRFFLGLFEAGNYPCCIKTARLWFPAGERAIAVGIFNAGTNVGAMITPIVIPTILYFWGWQEAFYLIGAVGLIWLFFWWHFYHDPDEHPAVSRNELSYVQSETEPAVAKIPYSRIIKFRATWAYAIGTMLSAPVFWFYLYWLPPYLNQQYKLGISVTELGAPLIVIYLSADVGSIIGGALSSAMIGRGMRPIPARMLSMLICALCIVPIVFASSASGLWMAVLYISIAIAAHQAWTANIWALVMDMSPKNAVASVFGFGGMFSAIGGMFMTQIVGYVLTKTHNNYSLLFMMIPTAYLIALVWVYFVAPRRPETFTGPESAADPYPSE
jgi:ACS family hexuronate transporter-like MFS transporter